MIRILSFIRNLVKPPILGGISHWGKDRWAASAVVTKPKPKLLRCGRHQFCVALVCAKIAVVLQIELFPTVGQRVTQMDFTCCYAGDFDFTFALRH